MSRVRVPAIEIRSLGKTYRGSDKPALTDLSLSIESGEVYGFLGPNGAGKSTTIRTLLNFIQPSNGGASILGHDIVKDALLIRSSVGYLSGDMAMYPKMTGAEYLDYMADLQELSDRKIIKKLAKKLTADLDKKLGSLSRGNRQKIGIIQAFMHDPDVLILDEPSSGLDPLVQETFYELVRDAKSRGAAIFMSSHILSEVQKVCDRVGIIKDGMLISEKVIAEMAVEASQTFDIEFIGKTPLKELKAVKGARVESSDALHATVHMTGPLSSLFAVLARHEVRSLDARTLDLEESFMQFYETAKGKKS